MPEPAVPVAVNFPPARNLKTDGIALFMDIRHSQLCAVFHEGVRLSSTDFEVEFTVKLNSTWKYAKWNLTFHFTQSFLHLNLL